MKTEVAVLLAVCAAAAATTAAPEPNPFDFLFNRCLQPDANGDIGDCVEDLLETALERDRANFSTGLRLGNRTVVLEPVKIPDAMDRNHDTPKWSIKEGSLSGLQEVRLESVLLTEQKAAAVVSFPELTVESRITVRYGFLPLRARMTVRLLEPRLMVGASWSAEAGSLQLTEPEAKLWLDGFNVTITGVSSIGRSVAQSLNDNSESIIEFMRPSLEEAVKRELARLDQKKLDGVLRWLEDVVSKA